MRQKAPVSRLVFLSLLPVLMILISLLVGRYAISPAEVIRGLWQGATGAPMGVSPETAAVVFNVRLPRALMGALVGGSLAIAGCAFQSLFHNPLVSPGLLGVTNGAGFGAALAIVFFAGSIWVTPMAFFFAIAAVLITHAVAKIWGNVSTIMLVLAGTIVSSVFSSLLAFMKYLAEPSRELASIVFWTLGSLASLDPDLMPWAFACMAGGTVLLIAVAWPLNLLSMGEREAISMGVSTKRTGGLVIIGATLTTAGAVSIAGSIGWVGLVVPHMARTLVGNDNRRLLPASFSIGSAFLVMIDLIARSLTGSEIPLGLMTALIGGPFFIGLMKKYKGSGFQ